MSEYAALSVCSMSFDLLVKSSYMCICCSYMCMKLLVKYYAYMFSKKKLFFVLYTPCSLPLCSVHYMLNANIFKPKKSDG